MFQIGDRVRVRATGKRVTVKAVNRKGVTVSWYETGEGWTEKVFPESALQSVGRGRWAGLTLRQARRDAWKRL